jgi:predicted nucleic acid-binding protein
MILLDTNILVDYFREKPQAVEFIKRRGKSSMAITTIVAMELYRGALNSKELRVIKKEITGFTIIDVNESTSQVALKLSERFALSHQMDIPDTLIAATALVYDLELRTYNLKDFGFIPGIKVSNDLD